MASISLKDHHLFRRQGRLHLLNVEDMQVSLIDEPDALVLQEVSRSPDVRNSRGEIERLRELGMLRDELEIAEPSERGTANTSIAAAVLCLTESCNLRCVYCYQGDERRHRRRRMDEKVSFQAVDWLIRQSGNLDEVYFGFTGGEPFLAFDLMQKTGHYARKRCREAGKRARFQITTNGTLLDDTKLAFLRDFNVFVRLSVDGTKEVHDAQRPFADGRGTFDVVRENCGRLREVCPDLEAHAVLLGASTPLETKAALFSMGVTDASVRWGACSQPDALSERGRYRHTQSALEGLDDEADLWGRWIEARDRQSLTALKREGSLHGGMVALSQGKKRHYGCVAGFGFVGISSEGDVFPCHRFMGMSDYRMGSVFENDLDRGRYLTPVDSVAGCAACFARFYCGGGCKHENVSLCGDVFSPAGDLCRLKRRELELAGSIVVSLTQPDIDYLTEIEILPPTNRFLGLFDGDWERGVG